MEYFCIYLILKGLFILSDVVLISYYNSNIFTFYLLGYNQGGIAKEFANNIKNFFWLVGVPKGYISFQGVDGDFFRQVFWGVQFSYRCSSSGNISLGVGQ